MTGAYTEDPTTPREGKPSERKSLESIGPSSCESAAERTTREEEPTPESHGESTSTRRSATGGGKGTEEAETLGRDRRSPMPSHGETEQPELAQNENDDSSAATECEPVQSARSPEYFEKIRSPLPSVESPDSSAEMDRSKLSLDLDPDVSADLDSYLDLEETTITETGDSSAEEDPRVVSLVHDFKEAVLSLPQRHSLELDGKEAREEEELFERCVADPESQLSFHEAVRAGDDKCVAALLASGAVENLDEPDWNVSGDPPLLVAATNHCLPVLSLLLANGCDPGVRSPRGESALHRAILNGGSAGMVLRLVEELLKHGCPAAVKEAGGGLTALHVLARQLAHEKSSKNLRRNFEATRETLDLLAKAGPVNAKDHQGRGALHILASSTIFDSNNTAEIEALIETLLAAGADPSLKNDRGETPLHECLECGALNTGFLLIAHTPAGVTSRYGETPLHIASRKNHAGMVAKLLERGEDPSVQDAGGNTPLHLASARGFHRTVSLLVTSPLAQLEKVNGEGLTALQVAAESGFVNAVKLLLKAGADPTHTVHYCATTLHRHPDISVLIDHELTRRRQLAA